MTEQKEYPTTSTNRIKLYNVFVINIADPELIASNVTREQCDAKIEELMADGVSPQRIKVRRIS